MPTIIDRYIEKGELQEIRFGEATILLSQIRLNFGAVSKRDRRRIESANAKVC
jgi:hypothetical protein